MGIIKEANLEKIRSFRKILFKVAIWVFVGGVIMGALFIALGGAQSADAFGRVMGTLFVIAILLAVASNCFRLLEEEASAVQVFAMIGLGFSIAAAILIILNVWGAFEIEECISSWCTTHRITTMGKIMSVISDIAVLGVIGSNIMAINEYDKGSVIRPFKITATVCLCVEFIYVIIVACAGELEFSETNMRFSALAGFAGLIWIMAWFVAWIISRNARKQVVRANSNSEHELLEKVQKQLDDLVKANAGVKATTDTGTDTGTDTTTDTGAAMSEEEKKMREEIEKRVRAELIEKEIREKVEAEMKAKKAAEK